MFSKVFADGMIHSGSVHKITLPELMTGVSDVHVGGANLVEISHAFKLVGPAILGGGQTIDQSVLDKTQGK